MNNLLRFLVVIGTLMSGASESLADSRRMLTPAPFHYSQISPTGQYVAAYENGADNDPKVVVFDSKAKKADRFHVSDGKGGNATVSELKWVGPETLAITSDGEDGDKWLHLFKCGDRSPTRIVKEGSRSIAAAFPQRSEFFILERIELDGSTVSRLLKYDSSDASKEPTEIFRKAATDLQCVLDAEGQLKLAKYTMDGEASWYAVSPEMNETKLTEIPQWSNVYGIDSTTGNALISVTLYNKLPALYEFDFANDKIVQTLADNELYSVEKYGQPVFDPESRKVVGLHLDIVERRSFWTDSAIGYIQNQLDEKLPGSINRILGWSQNRSKALVQRYIPNFPSPILHVDLSTDEIIPVFLNGPPIKPDEVGPTRLVDIPNRDGTVLKSVLTIPADKPDGKFPLVIWIRPGVWTGLERPEWHPEANFFAAEGYVVLRVNYSGTEGVLGPVEIDKQTIPGLMKTFEDIEDCARALIQAGLVDPEKICIAGENEGAWAAAYAPIATPDFYRAVVSINGVYDLVAYRGDNEVGGGMHIPFASSGTKLSKAEIEKITVTQNVSDYAKYAFVTVGNWSPSAYKNQINDFVKALKKKKVTVKSFTDDWWGTQLNGPNRFDAFNNASKLLKSATK